MKNFKRILKALGIVLLAYLLIAIFVIGFIYLDKYVNQYISTIVIRLVSITLTTAMVYSYLK